MLRTIKRVGVCVKRKAKLAFYGQNHDCWKKIEPREIVKSFKFTYGVSQPIRPSRAQ
jgi:hypothetical protein